MSKGKNVLTTGDVAKICNVAPRTVSKWFDSGQLKGYRIPGSKDRRIPVNELVRFMKANNIPTTALPATKTRVLIVDGNGDISTTLKDTLQTRGDYEVQTAHSNFQTGLIAHKFIPHIIMVSLLSNGIDVSDICRSIRESEELQSIKIIAFTNKLSDSESDALLRKGFDGHICNCCDVNDVINQIEQATTVVN